jgi:glycosidase
MDLRPRHRAVLPADPARWAAHYGHHGDELDLPLTFTFRSAPFTGDVFRHMVETIEAALPAEAWPIYALGNHDVSWLASRYADEDSHGTTRARLAALLLLTMRGTPLLYYGDELGTTDVPTPAGQATDPNGRDPNGTPMHWAPGPVKSPLTLRWPSSFPRTRPCARSSTMALAAATTSGP